MSDLETVYRQSDTLHPAPARLVQAALGTCLDLSKGADLPPFFHQLYFWDPQVADNLGPDGHPKVGGLIPDMGLPRRMWAGGRLAFHRPLVIGQTAEKKSVCETSSYKTGRSGRLGFVTLRHEIWQDGALRVTDWQDLVYREEPDPDARPIPPKMAPQDEGQAVPQSFDTTTLFRYSAATCNGHRIHYDLDYATKTEGYRGLVVHGPLLAQLLMLQASKTLGGLSAFEFRAQSPVMHFETVDLCHRWDEDVLTMWVRVRDDGRLAMTATAQR